VQQTATPEVAPVEETTKPTLVGFELNIA